MTSYETTMMMFDPNSEENRKLINEHKMDRMTNPFKSHILETISKKSLHAFWVEQIGDAELYEEEYKKRDK